MTVQITADLIKINAPHFDDMPIGEIISIPDIDSQELLMEIDKLVKFEEEQGIYRNEVNYTDVIDIIDKLLACTASVD